jgi:signal transduction histidine kinase
LADLKQTIAELEQRLQASLAERDELVRQQAATAEVLAAINSSGFDLDRILQILVSTAARLCKTGPASIFLLEGDVYRFRTGQNVTEAFREHEKKTEIRAGRGLLVGRVAIEKGVVQIIDALADAEYEDKEAASVNNFRSMLGVPLLRNGEPIGVFALARTHVEPFSESQIKLVSTFANQAVIAIEGAQLFDEVQAKTRDLTESLQQQTATSDVLKVISRSAFDLKTVLDALIGSAAQLCDASAAHIYLREAEVYKLAACAGFSEEYEKLLKERPMVPGRGTLVGRTAHEGRIVCIPDALSDPEYKFQDAQRLGGFRTMLGIPMLRDGTPIGVLGMTRSEVRPFTNKQIDLVTTFADQAVIAIENVRLFVEVQQRTKELSQSLEDLRTAQDRLVQTEKLASLGQLTAGIAHEIKNPLNFVNNFSALSAELVGEMKDALSDIDLDINKRKELDEIAQMLKDNLEKVVQHGKRADSIVKNMLLHSREGSGEHRPADINAIVDESLNLAYHGARAEKAGFSIAFQRDLDPSVGMADVYPQEIMRVLLNLISNGFYAATKRKAEAGDGFEPMLSATTRNLGDKVEIRIRDNGTGIPEEVKEKIFNPFFTTKPSGEGTGLGLSMSHDIVVKQHGGSIDVETEPGVFTEFKIVLPRATQT